MNGEEVLQQMNIAEFAGRMREQAARIKGFANAATEAPNSVRAAGWYFIGVELDMLQERLDRTRTWLKQQEGGESTK